MGFVGAHQPLRKVRISQQQSERFIGEQMAPRDTFSKSAVRVLRCDFFVLGRMRE